MTSRHYMVKEESAFSDGRQLRYSVRLPWYRSLPLSSIYDVKVEVNGESIDSSALTVRVNGLTRTIDEMEPRWDEWWFTQDEGTVIITDDAVAAQESIEVRTTIRLRIPYIIIGPEQALVTSTSNVVRFTVKKDTIE